jgi:hypothetical protein
MPADRPRDPDAPPAPGWNREGEFLWRRRVRVQGAGVVPWTGPVGPGIGSAGELCFYDTETTGLSGGAGTLVFLIGTAWCEGEDLAVEQLFLADFPGEEQFLQEASRRFARHAAFVSYNGKAFDSRLLSSRFLMNRMAYDPGLQLDLLHHARRLWRRIAGDCSLPSIERSILGVERGMDIAGEDVPLVYFEYLKTGRPGLLPAVFEHNLTDVTSLARMYAVIGRLLAGDLEAAPVDRRALGRWLLSAGGRSGTDLLEGAFARGDLEAGVELGFHHKRAGEWDPAVRVWRAVVEEARQGRRDPRTAAVAAVELAKFLEHRARDPLAALAVVEEMLGWRLPLAARGLREAERRRERLARRAARLTARSS